MGKSTTIEILKEAKSYDVKPTSGIEYNFIKKAHNAS